MHSFSRHYFANCVTASDTAVSRPSQKRCHQTQARYIVFFIVFFSPKPPARRPQTMVAWVSLGGSVAVLTVWCLWDSRSRLDEYLGEYFESLTGFSNNTSGSGCRIKHEDSDRTN
ncbi:hypothetical protein RRG08_014408 [Elysia crispata]|uniref:Uncharacterized protein n=1 Tax=Elysia crispata TaxID=231223 RepID=A0AAE0YVK9_9GAST|nr:hypothetical protein RRG08_014408 [Elysia crispata]